MEEEKKEEVGLTDLEEENPTKEKKQSSEENHKWAEWRKQKAKELAEKNAEISKLKEENSKIAFKAKAESIDQEILDKLGIPKIEDDDDLNLVSAYKEAIKNDSEDPVRDAYKNRYISVKEINSKKAKYDEAIKADYKKLVDTFGNIPSINSLMDDELFKKKYAPLLSSENPNLSLVYGLYKDEVDRLTKEKEKEAKKDSSLYKKVETNASGAPISKDYNSMSKEEKIKYLKDNGYLD